MRNPIGLLVAALFVFTSARVSAQDRAPIERSFAVRTGGDLRVDLDRGSITVETNDRNQVDVRIEREGSNEFLSRLSFDVDESGGDVTVRGRYESNRLWSRTGRGDRVRVRIRVPREYNVDLETSGGSIGVDDLTGSVRAATSGGSLSFGRIDGPIHARTSGGSVELQGSRGEADVKTSGGSIRLGDVGGHVTAVTSGGSITIDRAGGEVNASTSGGGITVNEVGGAIRARTSGGSIRAYISEQPTADCSLETSGGQVAVTLAPDVRLNIEANSSGGGVRTDIPIEVVGTVKRNSVRGSINGGGPLLRLQSSGGGVRISR